MKLKDYDQGKPLTARRILAVKAAIDADGTAKARSAAFAEATSAATKSINSLSRTFDPGQVAASAKAALAAAAADPDAVKIVANFGLVCDDCFFLKPTDAVRPLLRTVDLRPPYEGARNYFFVADVDDHSYLSSLVRETCRALAEK